MMVLPSLEDESLEDANDGTSLSIVHEQKIHYGATLQLVLASNSQHLTTQFIQQQKIQKFGSSLKLKKYNLKEKVQYVSCNISFPPL